MYLQLQKFGLIGDGALKNINKVEKEIKDSK
jgi:hypothetical protein